MNFACQFCKNSKVYCRCVDCEIFLCSQCDYIEHHHLSNQFDKTDNPLQHKRIRICEECEEQECATQCLSCEQFLCHSCSSRLHQKGARQKHKRQPIHGSPDFIRPLKLKSASSSQEPPINNSSSQEGRESQSPRKNSADNAEYSNENNQNQNQGEFLGKKGKHNASYTQSQQRQTYYAKNSNYDNKPRVNQYQQSGNYPQNQSRNTQNPRGSKGSSSYSSGGSSAGSHHNSYNNYGRGYSENYYGQYGTANRNAKPYKKSQVVVGGHSGSNRDQNNCQQISDVIPPQFFEGDQIVIPVWQPFVKCEKNQKEMFVIQKELFQFAAKGELLIENNLFIGILADKLQIQESECQRLIDQAEDQGIIHQTKRNFVKIKTLSFLSLQLEIITHECISWVVASLKRDEMTPTEKALQNRIKEAFAFKIPTSLWEIITESLETPEVKQHKTNTKMLYIEVSQSKGKAGYYGNSYNEYYNVQKDGYQEHTDYQDFFVYPDKKNDSIPLFKVKEIEEDPSIGQMTKAVYLIDEEEWLGVDQNIEDVDYQLYDQLKSFLQDYFCSNQDQTYDEEEQKWCSSIENALTRTTTSTQNQNTTKYYHGQSSELDFDEVRAIPGGRYGCAQFVKICGPMNLRQCSLGRLAQLVQYAVKEDVLRYHKTLLVWTTTVDKHKRLAEEIHKQSHQNAAIAAKLNVVKNALTEILAESKTGMSLAQLPLYLRRKLPFTLDLNELGFPKLKDLILSMSDQIKLELKGHNHPFAYLIKSGRYVHSTSNSDDFKSIPQSKTFIKTQQSHNSEDVNIGRHLKNAIAINEGNIKNVLTAFYNLMREYPIGIKSYELPTILSNKIGQSFSFKDYGCHSLLEFLKKYVIPTMDIEIISSSPQENDAYLIRSKQFFMNYNYELAQNQNMSVQKNATQMNSPKFNQIINTGQQNIFNQNSQKDEKQMNRQNSASSSLNVSSQCYVPNHQSLYGGSTSANSTQINVSHIRFNTADTAEIQTHNFAKNEIHPTNAINANPFQKPPLPPPQINQQFSQITQSQFKNQFYTQQINNQQRQNNYKTYPPLQLQQQFQQQQQAQNFISHQQSPSNTTTFSLQSYNPPQNNFPNQVLPGFFLSPSHLQLNKNMDLMSQNAMINNNSPLHSRAISFNNSAYGASGNNIQSTTSKSVSQDYTNSMQSLAYPHSMSLKQLNMQNIGQSQSGFATPQTQLNMISNLNFPNKAFGQRQNQDSIFGSPIPNSFQFDSLNGGKYESSPPYNQDEDDSNFNQHNIKFIEKLVCDDDMDFKSGDEQSSMSIQSPQLSAVATNGLRVPISNFQNSGPGLTLNQTRSLNQSQQKKNWGSVDIKNQGGGSVNSSSHKQLGGSQMQSSNSCKNIVGNPIIEGGSTSSDENKRPSTVLEQKTEEDAEDNTASQQNLNQRWSHLQNSNQLSEDESIWSNPQNQQQDSLWTKDVNLFKE